jgi:hypothetical protein
MNAAFSALLAAIVLAAPAKPAPDAVAWGPVTDGLRAGLRVGNTTGKWEQGKDVPITVVLWNTTQSPLRVDFYKPPLIGWAPTIKDAKGKPAMVMTPPLDYPVAPDSLTLKPGQTVDLGSSTIAVRAPKGGMGEGALMSTLAAKPGKYRVSHAYRFEKREPGGWVGEIVTGEITFEVVPPPTERSARRN